MTRIAYFAHNIEDAAIRRRAATLQAIERDWVEAGFPADIAAIIGRRVAQALLSSQ
jgi:hypothetical protein